MHFSSPRSTEALRATYRWIAPVYDMLVPYVSGKARTLGLTWLDVQDGERLLDVGTGTGLSLVNLAGANPVGWTEGVDLSPVMLDRARRRMAAACPHPRYGLRLADATNLPYPSDTFDAVFSSYFLDVLPALLIRRALREIRRVLRPQGRLVLIYLTAPQQAIEHFWTTLAQSLPPLSGGARPVALESLLRGCGFEVLAQTTRTQRGLRSAVMRALPSGE